MHNTVLLFLCLLISNKYLVRSASLDEFGHYRFVVAIDEDTIQNDNVDYVKNIQVPEHFMTVYISIYLGYGHFLRIFITKLIISEFHV